MIEHLMFSFCMIAYSFLVLFWGWSIGKGSMAKDFKRYGKARWEESIYHCEKIEPLFEDKDPKP